MNEVATRTGWEMNPADAQQAMDMARWISESGLVPAKFQGKPKDICVAAAMGSKLGLDVFSSMQGIAVINGTPSLWGDVLRGLIVGRSDLTDIVEEYENEDDPENIVAVCIITRGKRSPHRATFGMDDARNAGLLGKDVWKKFTKDMLLNRAFSRAARRAYADVLSGVHVAEEMIDAEIVKEVEAENVSDSTSDADSRDEKVSTAKPKKAKARKPAAKADPKSEGDDPPFNDEGTATRKEHAQAIIEGVVVKDDGGDLKDKADVATSVPVDYEVLLQAYKEAKSVDAEEVAAIMTRYTGADGKNVSDVPEIKWQRCWDDLVAITEYR